jgi:hypothetical protein
VASTTKVEDKRGQSQKLIGEIGRELPGLDPRALAVVLRELRTLRGIVRLSQRPTEPPFSRTVQEALALTRPGRQTAGKMAGRTQKAR